jgi:hypothetical protein
MALLHRILIRELHVYTPPVDVIRHVRSKIERPKRTDRAHRVMRHTCYRDCLAEMAEDLQLVRDFRL